MNSFIEFLKIVVFGVVEGFTEWLPISSTGHLILVENIVHLNVSEEFMNVFRVVIQLGGSFLGCHVVVSLCVAGNHVKWLTCVCSQDLVELLFCL